MAEAPADGADTQDAAARQAASELGTVQVSGRGRYATKVDGWSVTASMLCLRHDRLMSCPA